MNKLNNKTGFTLVELLVVIVIIGILATLATVALSSAREKARDARRISDIKQTQTALELYFNDNQNYPSTNLNAQLLSIAFGTRLASYLPATPADPLTSDCSTYTGYKYTARDADGLASTGATPPSYSIEYCLKGTTGQISAGWHTASTRGIK